MDWSVVARGISLISPPPTSLVGRGERKYALLVVVEATGMGLRRVNYTPNCCSREAPFRARARSLSDTRGAAKCVPLSMRCLSNFASLLRVRTLFQVQFAQQCFPLSFAVRGAVGRTV
ncbi:hypothetical protein TRVL_03501 [Trypanosoma vivax]|nr:hypothetical protein TRVL_03501 [Trypanosoma vivax]